MHVLFSDGLRPEDNPAPRRKKTVIIKRKAGASPLLFGKY